MDAAAHAPTSTNPVKAIIPTADEARSLNLARDVGSFDCRTNLAPRTVLIATY
jgi:hypothetical protein